MKRLLLAVAALLLAATVALAQSGHQHHGADAPSEGEVRKVDKAAQKITIKHGPLQNLDMPAMTMVFKVNDPAMLERVKPGDQVKFRAEDVSGTITVTRIDLAK